MWSVVKRLFTRSATLRLQAALERTERIFRSTHGYGYFDWDLTQERILWSGGFWQHLGYSENDDEAISFSERYYDYVHPEDAPALRLVVKRLVKGETSQGFAQYRVRKKNGQYIWTEVRADTTRLKNGRASHISGIVVTIDQQKQVQQALEISEQRHARILESTNDGIWEWDVASQSFQFTRRCWEHLGFTHASEIVPPHSNPLKIWRQRMHSEDLIHFDEAINLHMYFHQPFDVEYRIKGKHSDWVWIRARGKLVYSEDGQPLVMSGSNINITELKTAQQRLQTAKEHAEKANQAKSEFLSSMSHEFRTPLNAVLGYAQLLNMDTSLNTQQKQHTQEILRAGNIVLRLINDNLDLASIEAGQIHLNKAPTHPTALIQYCLGLVKTQADARAIALHYQADETLPLLYTDATRLQQILLNLLSNSIKYNKQGGQVTLSCTPHGRCLRFTLTDTGQGIALEKQAQLFEAFNRLGQENSAIEGAGIGLAIAKKLTQLLGGQLGFSSQPQIGSEFWVELPLPPTQATPPTPAQPIEPLVCILPQHLSPASIVYVDTNPNNQTLITQLLAHYPQLQVHCESSALKALFYCRSHTPSLIITDIHLPEITGFELLTLLRQDPHCAQIPIIALSAKAMAHDIQQGLHAGFTHYLTQPLRFEALLQVLQTALPVPPVL